MQVLYICFIIIIFDYNSNIVIIMLYYARMYKAGSSSITNAIAPADAFVPVCSSLALHLTRHVPGHYSVQSIFSSHFIG